MNLNGRMKFAAQIQSSLLCLWCDHTSLRGATAAFLQTAFHQLHWTLQPTPDVKPNPFLWNVLFNRTHHQVMIDSVKEGFHIQVQHPIITPAVTPSLVHGLMGISTRPRKISSWLSPQYKILCGYFVGINDLLGRVVLGFGMIRI
jgi:hypothetical protein